MGEEEHHREKAREGQMERKIINNSTEQLKRQFKFCVFKVNERGVQRKHLYQKTLVLTTDTQKITVIQSYQSMCLSKRQGLVRLVTKRALTTVP